MATKIVPNRGAAASKPKTEKVKKPKRAPFVDKVNQNEDGEYIEAMPTGFSFEKFPPIAGKKFAGKHLALRHKAKFYIYRSEQLEKLAKEYEAGGGKASGKVKRLEKQLDKMQELVEQLKAAGQDVSKFEAILEAQKAAQ